jgi:N-formylglutamate amidohydrolase
MGQNQIWKVLSDLGPIVATAIHDGHKLREEVAAIITLDDDVRLMEEDPFTAKWTTIGNTQIIGTHSRFEVDLNRPREKAVYVIPEDAWGLKIYDFEPSAYIISRSLKEYDDFYKEVHQIFSRLEKQFGQFVIFDLHTYNYRREGPEGPPADPNENPEVNIGTGTMNREKWAPLIDRFISDLRNFNFNGRQLDVRENVKFKGGQFPKWIHQTFPNSACALSIEFKKFFMDEWTGEPDNQQIEEIQLALKSTVPGVLEELKKLKIKC